MHTFTVGRRKMEIRKLQTNAAGTFIVTIPKDWAKDLTLHKGDLVNVELEESDIVISPTKSKKLSKSKPLNIEEFKDQKILELCITASYIQGNDMTEIVSKTKIGPDQKRWIRKAADGLIGVEITEDFADRVVLQNLADPARFELDELLQRFAETSKAVFQDAIRALVAADLSLAQDAYERGEQSIKVYRLLMRLALQAAKSKNVREQMKLEDIASVIIKIIAIRELGRMAYYSMRIAQHVAEIGRKLDDQLIQIIQKLTKISVEMQDQSLTALMKKDLVTASSLVDRMVQVRKLYEAAFPLIGKHEERTALALSLIVRDIRAFAGYAVALADDAVLGVFEM
jgi:AbrB family looped-hinge helix DNA binding protein